MEYITLPNTDLKVSPICIGGWQFNDSQLAPDETCPVQSFETSQQVVEKALECGVNFIDTAEAYRNSERTLGRILGGRRQDVVLATKFGWRVADYTPEEINTSISNSLQRLQTDYLDIIQIHFASHAGDMVACVTELKRQQALGRIRYYGVSNFGVNSMKKFIAAGGQPITNQLPYSLLWRAIEYEIVPYCREAGLSVMAYSPLQQGLLSGRYRAAADVPAGRRRSRLFHHNSTELARHGQEGVEKELFEAINAIGEVCKEANESMPASALSWCLHNPQVKVVIVGSQSAKQVEETVKLITLKQNVVNKLNGVTDELKDLLGNNADPWAKESRIY